MEYNKISVSIMDKVGIITFNNSQTNGFMDSLMLKELAHQISEWNDNSEINIILMKGENSFVSGVDLKDLANPEKLKDMQNDFKKIIETKKILISAVSGYALGVGFDLALSSDIVLASDDARFAYPEISLDLPPCFGGIQRLATLAGRSKATEIILTGRAVNAEEAERIGIVSRIVPFFNLLEDSLSTAQKISEKAYGIIHSTKAVIDSAFTDIIFGIDVEMTNAETFSTSKEFREAISKMRKPNK